MSKNLEMDSFMIGKILKSGFLVFCSTVFVQSLSAQTGQSTKGIQGKPVEWRIGLYNEEDDVPQASLSELQSTRRISLFSDSAIVPSLVGLSLAEAVDKLSEEGLEFSSQTKSPHPMDTVTAQDIQAGTKTEFGKKIQLALSSTVPNVVGKKLGEAYFELSKKNRYVMKYRGGLPEDLVISSQKPEGGSKLERGEDVVVVCKVVVPDVKNKTVKEAKEILDKSSLKWKINSPDYLPTDVIKSQTITPNKSVVAGNTIGILPAVEVPNFIGKTEEEVVALLKKTGIDARPKTEPVRTLLALQHGNIEIKRQSMKPGELIGRGSRLTITAIQYIYQPEPTRPIVLVNRGFVAPTYRRNPNAPIRTSQNNFDETTCCPACRSQVCRCESGNGGFGGGGLNGGGGFGGGGFNDNQ